MDPVLVFDLITKGVSLLPTLVSAGIDITQRVEQLITLSKGGAAGTLDDAAIAKIRADFDADLAEFNSDLPD
jgi:hypothetical protein